VYGPPLNTHHEFGRHEIDLREPMVRTLCAATGVLPNGRRSAANRAIVNTY
jgi:hypothetical protein